MERHQHFLAADVGEQQFHCPFYILGMGTVPTFLPFAKLTKKKLCTEQRCSSRTDLNETVMIFAFPMLKDGSKNSSILYSNCLGLPFFWDQKSHCTFTFWEREPYQRFVSKS